MALSMLPSSRLPTAENAWLVPIACTCEALYALFVTLANTTRLLVARAASNAQWVNMAQKRESNLSIHASNARSVHAMRVKAALLVQSSHVVLTSQTRVQSRDSSPQLARRV